MGRFPVVLIYLLSRVGINMICRQTSSKSYLQPCNQSVFLIEEYQIINSVHRVVGCFIV